MTARSCVPCNRTLVYEGRNKRVREPFFIARREAAVHTRTAWRPRSSHQAFPSSPLARSANTATFQRGGGGVCCHLQPSTRQLSGSSPSLSFSTFFSPSDVSQMIRTSFSPLPVLPTPLLTLLPLTDATSLSRRRLSSTIGQLRFLSIWNNKLSRQYKDKEDVHQDLNAFLAKNKASEIYETTPRDPKITRECKTECDVHEGKSRKKWSGLESRLTDTQPQTMLILRSRQRSRRRQADPSMPIGMVDPRGPLKSWLSSLAHCLPQVASLPPSLSFPVLKGLAYGRGIRSGWGGGKGEGVCQGQNIPPVIMSDATEGGIALGMSTLGGVLRVDNGRGVT